jgi:hypothetical protein
MCTTSNTQTYNIPQVHSWLLEIPMALEPLPLFHCYTRHLTSIMTRCYTNDISGNKDWTWVLQITWGSVLITGGISEPWFSSSVMSVTSYTVTQVTSLPSWQNVIQMTSWVLKTESGYYKLPEVQSLLLEVSVDLGPLPSLHKSPPPLLCRSPYFPSERMLRKFSTM